MHCILPIIRILNKLRIARLWMLVAQTSGSRIYTLIASILTLSITARLLGPDGRGAVAAAITWAGLFATLGSFSIGQVSIHLSSEKRTKDWLPLVFGTELAIVSVVSAMVATVVTLLYQFTNGAIFNNLGASLLILVLITVPFLLIIDNNRYLLMTLDQLRIQNIAEVVGSTLSILAVLLFVALLKWDVIGALLAVLITRAVTALIGCIFIARRIVAVRFAWDTAYELIGGGLKLHLNAIGSLLYLQANILILNYYGSSSDTAYYQLAVQLIGIAQIVPISIGSVMYTLVADKGANNSWPIQRRVLLQSLLLSVVLMASGFLFAPMAIEIVAGPQFYPTVSLFRWLLICLPGMTMSAVMASQWIGRGLFIQTSAITLAIGVVNLLLSFVLIPQYGTVGAVYATIGTYLFSVIGNGLMAIWVNRQWQKSLSF